jgi:hypothetical protein
MQDNLPVASINCAVTRSVHLELMLSSVVVEKARKSLRIRLFPYRIAVTCQHPQLVKELTIQQLHTLPRRNMSFEVVSERLRVLQESNAQLKDLIDRLATLKFQPGSIPLDEGEDNAKVELTAEIHQIIKDQEEDLTILQEDVTDLDFGRSDGELQQQKALLDHVVKKAIQELRRYVKLCRPLESYILDHI